MLTRIDDLKASNEFLNILLDNITSAVFVVDADARIQSFNNSFSALFCKAEAQLLGERCGNAMGCAFAVTQERDCGETSNCDVCVLRNALLDAFLKNAPTYKERLSRVFYIDGQAVQKHFLFSARRLPFEDRDMTVVIVDDVSETENQRLKLMEDLEAAGEVQRCLLPSAEGCAPNIRAAWEFMPSQSLGGDIFNFFPLDPDHLAFYMLDVSGHGAPSAMVAALASQAIRPQGLRPRTPGEDGDVPSFRSPASVLRALDREFPIGRFDKFFTINYLVCDIRTGELVSSGAAHPHPVILRGDGRMELLEKGGTIIGLNGLFPFEEERTRLAPGDRVYLYTDGVAEYRDPDGTFFGNERFHERIARTRDLDVDAAVKFLIAELLAFGRGLAPQDDVSLLAFEFAPEKGNGTAKG